MAEVYEDLPATLLNYSELTEKIEATERIVDTLWRAEETPVIALGRRLYSERLTELQAALASFLNVMEL